MAPTIGEACTVVVNNIPKNVTNDEVQAVFEDIGPLKKCFVVSNKNESEGEKSVAYITFALREDVETALKTPIEVGGSKVNVKVCERRAKKVGGEKGQGTTPKDIKEKRNLKKKWQQKKPRLIIRNLSFQVSEEDLKKECSIFGELAEVTIPTNSDGRKRGFGFIQFKETKNAIKAIKSLNLKKIKGRPVAIDFALPKNKFQENTLQSSPNEMVSDEHNDSEDGESNNENKSSDDDDDGDGSDESEEVKIDKRKPKVSPHKSTRKEDSDASESESSEEENDHKNATPGSKEDIVKDGDSRWFDMSSDDESRSSVGDEDDNMELDENESDRYSEDDSESESQKGSDKRQKPHPKSHAPNDARTLFIRNIPFMADEESYRECMEQFGEVTYALLCLDPETDHPKGTGFVRFKKIESSQKCLETANEESEIGLILDGRRIYASEALSKDDIIQKVKTKSLEKESKDKRNLYLAREGLIREGSLAAKGISKSDMAKRIQLEVKKKQMLRNLHFFVSRSRLVIHNLPPNIDDKELRQLFHHAANTKSCKITEAKVMKNLKQVSSVGKSPSKGFGFVTFTEHEHALAALRHLNNNPDVFTSKKRPIVEFSIENKKVLNAKTRKQEQNTKRLSNSDGNFMGSPSKEPPAKKFRKDKRQPSKTETNLTDDAKENFTGFISKKEIKTLPTHTGPKVRKRKNMKGVKENSKKPERPSSTYQTNNGYSETKKKSKRKRNKYPSKNEKLEHQDEKSFQKLVSKYRNTMVEGRRQSKGKWFEED